jgi:hypothetical protein
VDFGVALVAYSESAEAVEPGEAAFDHPTMFAEFFGAFQAPARNARHYASSAAGLSTARIVITFIGMAFFWPVPRTARPAANRRYRVEHVLKHFAVVDIGAGEPHSEWNAVALGHEMPFRARLAAIRWIWARGRPPFLAAMEEESAQTRLKSRRFAPRRRRSTSRCNRSQTPASCQSRRRRQQVTPEPHPSSGGRSAHAMPERSTNRMPLSAARSGIRGRPPRGFGAAGGRSFSNIGHRPSGIRTEGIPLYESTCTRRTRVLKGALSRFSLAWVISPSSAQTR